MKLKKIVSLLLALLMLLASAAAIAEVIPEPAKQEPAAAETKKEEPTEHKEEPKAEHREEPKAEEHREELRAEEAAEAPKAEEHKEEPKHDQQPEAAAQAPQAEESIPAEQPAEPVAEPVAEEAGEIANDELVTFDEEQVPMSDGQTDRSVMVKIDMPSVMEVGSAYRVSAKLSGFENVDYKIEWQYNDGNDWKTLEGETSLKHKVKVTRDSVRYSWRAIVTEAA